MMIPRLYVKDQLASHAVVTLDRHQLHYILNVLRLHEHDKLLLFNGQDGEWKASIKEATKKHAIIQCEVQTRPQKEEKDLILIASLIKPARFEFIVEKATELGITQLVPIVTDHTQIRKLNVERMNAQAREAAEQSERLSIPDIKNPLGLHEEIDQIESPIFWADESKENTDSFSQALAKIKGHHLLVGPEGGFSDKEKTYLRTKKNIIPVSLGPQILRAETANIIMVGLYQALQGSWREA